MQSERARKKSIIYKGSTAPQSCSQRLLLFRIINVSFNTYFSTVWIEIAVRKGPTASSTINFDSSSLQFSRVNQSIIDPWHESANTCIHHTIFTHILLMDSGRRLEHCLNCLQFNSNGLRIINFFFETYICGSVWSEMTILKGSSCIIRRVHSSTLRPSSASQKHVGTGARVSECVKPKHVHWFPHLFIWMWERYQHCPPWK